MVEPNSKSVISKNIGGSDPISRLWVPGAGVSIVFMQDYLDTWKHLKS